MLTKSTCRRTHCGTCSIRLELSLMRLGSLANRRFISNGCRTTTFRGTRLSHHACVRQRNYAIAGTDSSGYTSASPVELVGAGDVLARGPRPEDPRSPR